MRLGFAGLGRMGEPMASRLLDERHDLVVWNRSPGAVQRSRQRGARVAATPGDLFESCDCVILMLANLPAIEDVLGLHAPSSGVAIRGRIVVNMGTIAPGDSRALAAAVSARGAEFVEAPVSGSRVQAEQGTLVAMLAGRRDLLDSVEPVLAPLYQSCFRCGDVPQALLTKLAVNTFLITTVTGLAEAVLFAQNHRVDPALLRGVLDAGPMASDVSRIKVAKLLDADFTPQATVRDVRYNAELILEQAAGGGLALPLLEASRTLLAAASRCGGDDLDMVAVIEALRAGSAGDATESRSERA